MDRFKVFKNDEGIFRVQVSDSLGQRWLLDEDLMMGVISSHKSKILDFYSKDQAEAAIQQVLTKERLLQDRWVALNPQKPAAPPSDTFKPIV
jgi:hypothetical protein